MRKFGEFLDLYLKTFPESKRLIVNSELSGVKGFDAIRTLLEQFNIEIGEKIGPNKYTLIYNSIPMDNVILVGSFDGMRISKANTKPRQIPFDAYFSPAALYEQESSD
jgi:hypothetical protein